MQTRTAHVNVTKTAIGYVRVSTQEQVAEGVSLDKLIDVTVDEEVSGSTLEQPGLQVALRMLKRGRASTLRGGFELARNRLAAVERLHVRG